MQFFTRIMVVAVGLALLCFPIAAARYGWGFGTERNAQVVKVTGLEAGGCPNYQKDMFGRCKRSYRSYFGGRSAMGGGPGFGK
jgi:hypothetical protein